MFDWSDLGHADPIIQLVPDGLSELMLPSH